MRLQGAQPLERTGYAPGARRCATRRRLVHRRRALRGGRIGQARLAASLTIVTVDLGTMRAVPLPEALRSRMAAYAAG